MHEEDKLILILKKIIDWVLQWKISFNLDSSKFEKLFLVEN